METCPQLSNGWLERLVGSRLDSSFQHSKINTGLRHGLYIHEPATYQLITEGAEHKTLFNQMLVNNVFKIIP